MEKGYKANKILACFQTGRGVISPGKNPGVFGEKTGGKVHNPQLARGGRAPNFGQGIHSDQQGAPILCPTAVVGLRECAGQGTKKTFWGPPRGKKRGPPSWGPLKRWGGLKKYGGGPKEEKSFSPIYLSKKAQGGGGTGAFGEHAGADVQIFGGGDC